MRFVQASVPRRLAFYVCFAWLTSACSVYDAELVQKTSAATAPADDSSTLLPEAGTLPDSGPTNGPDQTPIAADDAGDKSLRCGDGLVSAVEKCDLGIAAGMPGACPTDCPPIGDDKCAIRALNGTGCQTECVLLPAVCKSGDGCCPGNCNADNDLDCSPSCGDGIIQQSRGETCEAGSATLCKTSAADCADSDPCTVDALTGTATNCNTVCTHTPITSPKAGDACCPTGANANTDSDCKPICGNNVKETGEDCDGSVGCSTDCKLTLQPSQITCLASAADDCEKCACMNCTATETACRLGTDATSNMQCNAVLVCARKNNCTGQACYCGANACLLAANGPCMKEIEASASSTDVLTISQRQTDQTMPIGKAWYADSCRVMQCQSTCR